MADATAVVDCSTASAAAPFHRYHRAQIRIRNTAGRNGDLANLASWGTDIERCFVRLNLWAPDALTGIGGAIPNPGLETDPSPNFTLGDSWVSQQNSRGVSLWVCHERLDEASWFPSAPDSDDYDVYEDVLYEILRHLHETANHIICFEPLNEPEIAANGPSSGASVWTPQQQYDFAKITCRAINRVNTEFSLTGDDRIFTSLPHWTESGLNSGVAEAFIDIAAADPEWDTLVKPLCKWWAIHGFQNPSIINRKVQNFVALDAYAAASAKPDLLEGMNRAVTAYNRSGDQALYNPTDSWMAQSAVFFAASSTLYRDYAGPEGEVIEHSIMFAQANYNDYGTSAVAPQRLNVNPSVAWDVDGVKTPVGNSFWMQERLGGGADGAVRLGVTMSGPRSVGTFHASNGTGVTCEAAHEPGSNTVQALPTYLLSVLDNTARDVDVVFQNLDAILPLDDDFIVRIWRLDRNTSRVAASGGGAALVSTQTVAAADTVTVTVEALSPSMFLIEIEATGVLVGPPDPTAPLAVTGLSPSAQVEQVQLGWSLPGDGGSAITDYVVQFKLTSEPTIWTTFSDGISTVRETTVTGLTPSVSYDFRVAAVNAIGTGAYSSVVSATPAAPAPPPSGGSEPLAALVSSGNNNSDLAEYVTGSVSITRPTLFATMGTGVSSSTYPTLTLPSGVTATQVHFAVRVAQGIQLNLWRLTGTGTGTVTVTYPTTTTGFLHGFVEITDGSDVHPTNVGQDSRANSQDLVAVLAAEPEATSGVLVLAGALTQNPGWTPPVDWEILGSPLQFAAPNRSLYFWWDEPAPAGDTYDPAATYSGAGLMIAVEIGAGEAIAVEDGGAGWGILAS